MGFFVRSKPLPVLTVPNSWGHPLQEFNPNHEPAGSPKGGQFAPKDSVQEHPPHLLRGAQVVAAQVAKTLKFPLERIVFQPPGTAPSYTMGTTSFTAGATYDPTTRTISVYGLPTVQRQWTVRDATTGEVTLLGDQTPSTVDAANFASMLAHEIQHDRFHTVMQAYRAEQDRIRDYDNKIYVEYAGAPYYELGQHTHTNAAGYLKPEHRDKYPTVAALEDFLEGGPVTERLNKEDGISDYSTRWWRNWQEGRGFGTGGFSPYQSVLNETQAEVAASLVSRKYGRAAQPPSPTWRKFYYAINREYTRLTRKPRRTPPAAP